MEIIEQYCQGKKDELSNEDAIFYNDDYVVIIDGVTAKGKKKDRGRKSGRVARDILMNTLPTIDGTASKKEFFTILHNALAENIPEDANIEDIPSACLLVYSNYYKQIWICGDSQYMINGEYYDNSKEFDKIVSNARSLFIELLVARGITEAEEMEKDFARIATKGLLKYQPVLENNFESPHGYIVLNGRTLCDEQIQEVDVEENDEIIFASDGYPFLKETLEESEEELKRVLKEDPLCYKIYKSTKGLKKGNVSYDDRCYIRFII